MHVEIIRSLGTNPMATVHLAREPALKRLVAVKALRPEYCDDPTAVRRFEREAQSAARITHNNVCSIHRVGRTPKGVPFIVMEYVEGRTLDALVAADGKLTVERIVALCLQISSAIAAAHEKGVIHRDVRPANVLVEKGSNRVVLTDFGIAAMHESGTELITRLTRQGERLGDPDYASPEQAAGETISEATDIYSLGLIGVDLCNAGVSDDERVGQSQTGLPVPLYDAVPTQLRELLKRCLAGNPEHRPTAASVRDELADLAASPEQLQKMDPKRDRTLFGVGLGFLAELRRRKVYRVAAGYAAGAIVLIEMIDVLAPTLRIPEWLFQIFVAGLLGGFPIAVTLAWMFDVTRKGLERTQDEGRTGAHRLLMFVVMPLFGLSLSIVAAAWVGWWILKA